MHIFDAFSLIDINANLSVYCVMLTLWIVFEYLTIGREKIYEMPLL